MLRKAGKELGIFVLLIVLCVFTAIENPHFLGAVNLQNTGRLIGMFGIFSIGEAIVIITGGIDLSVGSMFALLGVLLSIALIDWRVAPVPAVAFVLGFGAALGAIHGFLITKVKLQPFVVTLCGLLLYRGLAQFIAHDETRGFGESKSLHFLKYAANENLYGVPIPLVILLVVAAVFAVVLHRSVYGRYLYAVGRNEEAARYSGIQTKQVIAAAYIISGFLAGISAILFAFFNDSISPSMQGSSYELYGIAAAVLGGCSLQGGEGSIAGVLLGAALLQILQNLVNLLGIASSLNFAVMGAVILMGVVADRLLRRKSARA